jgi:FAD:protein FMN transferase
MSFRALGTTCVLGAESHALAEARNTAEQVIASIDLACSRFRDDSDLARVNAHPGTDVDVSAWFIDALTLALRAAWLTGGLVDPTVGTAMRMIGYDRDFGDVTRRDAPLVVRVRAVPGWERVIVDPARRTVRVERGVELDLGATAKAWCADCAAVAAADQTGVGVLVGLGGDLSCAGDAPVDGWLVRVADDHRASVDDPDGQTVSLASGGLATSGTSVRRWARGDRVFHHIVDPQTGIPATDYWRTVTVAAASCADANIASTASVILGARAPAWLATLGLSARLVGKSGRVTTVGDWPR